MNSPNTLSPLAGIRILDLSRLLPGPLGAMMLADMGAEVIKIENPQQPDYVRNFPPYYEIGEEMISANYLAFNRSKKSLALDYSSPEGKALFFRLVQSADVVIEQFRPGFLDKLGLGYAQAAAHNEKIIYVSVTGYGQTGPYAALAGHDLNYAAIAGVLGLSGSPEQPMMSGVQMADIAGGSYMTVAATLAALLARQQHGKGQHVDVSMTDGLLPLMAVAMAQYWANGRVEPRGEMPLSGGLVNYQVYCCEDGRFIALGALEPKFWMKFCQVIERPDLMGLALPQGIEAARKGQATLQGLFLSAPQAHWVALGLAHDLLISPVHEPQDLEQDPHLQAREMIVRQQHPRIGEVKSIGVPIKFSATPARPSGIAPEMGADTVALLQGLGLEEAEINRLIAEKIVAVAKY
jgi:crotonobetainyl-CoA:carnitine CoA-transferase CaiB-like acyl-CoA transferase